ncbi:hypothetical protein FKP32DRAFT_1088807 [Trametes sanguinea]|nr:hypothetical protein FKP32DRAFT_1088807 [Trametes sanguinea]
MKPILIDRYELWQASQRPTPGSSRASSTDPGLSREEIARRRRQEQDEQRAREAWEAARREEIWKQEEYVRNQAAERERQSAWRNSEEARREEMGTRRVVAEARALGSATERQRREEEYRRAQAEEQRRAQAAEEQRRDERTRRAAAEERRRYEQDGIMRRQQEADAAARATRRDIGRHTPSPVPGPSYRPPEPDVGPRTVYAPQPSRLPPPQQSSFTDPYGTGSTVPVMPLESPHKYDDDSSTDAESTEHGGASRGYRNDQTPKAKQTVPR